MAINIKSRDLDSRSKKVTKVSIDMLPKSCPICDWSFVFDPEMNSSFIYSMEDDCTRVEVVFLCPWPQCRSLFIGYYQGRTSPYRLVGAARPVVVVVVEEKRYFAQIISKISYNFCVIYNEAYVAEQRGLLNICGTGYRKALEFLVKDYACIGKTRKEQRVIKSKFLGKCIEEHISDGEIREIATRAAWLGNDETHYVRKWEDKDLKDLKTLIDMVVDWLELVERTKIIKKEMPASSKKR